MPRRTTRLLRTTTLLAGLAVLAGCGDGADDFVTWSTQPDDSCVGLTAQWDLPVATLQAMLSPELRPAPGPKPDSGAFLLFGVGCTGSMIGDTLSTGGLVSVHTLIPIESPPAGGALPDTLIDTWVAVPTTVGPAAAPVTGLWARHGFPVTAGDANLSIEQADEGIRAEIVIPLEQGEVRLALTGAVDSVAPTQITTGIVPPRDAEWMVLGPEVSRRQAMPTATLTLEGTTFLDDLELDPEPDAAFFDWGFFWTFTFREPPGAE